MNKCTIDTEHPHIEKIKGKAGRWQAVVKGTYIRVWALISCYKRGMDAWEMSRHFPTLTLAQIYDAISYYHDHQEEIDDLISENKLAYDQWKQEQSGTGLEVDKAIPQ